MEPTTFEDWVLRQLADAGYDTRRTPRTGDRGGDGLAFWPFDDEKHTIIVQCKHMQPDAKCGRAAIDEVLGSVPAYADKIVGDPRLMVVTNAIGFTADAELRARQAGVRLVDRHALSRLRTRRADSQ